jgi:hypothetical protein
MRFSKIKQYFRINKEGLSKFLKTFKEKMSEELAKIVIGFVIIIISSLFIWGKGFFQDIRVSLTNISEPTALAIAKSILGPDVSSVIPFKNRDDKAQFIAVLISSPSSYNTETIKFFQTELKLMVGKGNVYSLHEIGIESISPEWQLYFKILDIDKDGYKEIFAVSEHFTSYGFVFLHQIFSTKDDSIYKYEVSGLYDRAPTLTDQTPETDDGMIKSWLLNEVSKRYDEFSKNIDYDGAEWNRIHGVGYYNGKITKIVNKDFSKKIGSNKCQINEHEKSWVSKFKGPVYQVDNQKDEAFIIYNPPGPFNYIRSIINGRTRLWFGQIINDGLLVYNKSEGALELFEISNINSIVKNNEGNNEPYWGYLSLDENYQLYFNKIPIVFKNIRVGENEFKNFSMCQDF